MKRSKPAFFRMSVSSKTRIPCPSLPGRPQESTGFMSVHNSPSTRSKKTIRVLFTRTQSLTLHATLCVQWITLMTSAVLALQEVAMRRYRFALALLALLSPTMALISPASAALPMDRPALGLQCGFNFQLFSMDSHGNITTIVKPEWCGWTFAVTMDGTPLTTSERGPTYYQPATLWSIDPSTGEVTQRVRALPRNTQCIAVNPVPVPSPGGGSFPADSIFLVVQPSFNPHLLVVQPGKTWEDIGLMGNGYNWWHDAECAFNSEGRLFMVAQTGSNYRLREINTASGELLSRQELDLDIRFLESITFTAGDDLIATGADDKRRIWAFTIDPDTGKMHEKRLLRKLEDGETIIRGSIDIQPTPPAAARP